MYTRQTMGSGFIQQIFGEISFEKNQSLWMSDDDSRLVERLNLLCLFPQTSFEKQFNSKSRDIFKKNDKLCKALCEKASLANAQGNLEMALSLYNQSLMYSPEDEMTAIILADRASILIEKGEYELGIKDINKALASSYPENLCYKLFERLGESHEEIGHFDKAKDAYNNALKTLDKAMKPGTGKRNSLEYRINNKIKFLNNNRNTPKTIYHKANKSQQYFKIPKTHQNSGYPNLMNGLQVKYSPTKGRYIVANRDIAPGELIAADEPYVWILDRDEARIYCWNCLSKNVAPLPCPKCVNVLFCSEKCLNEALKEYHSNECDIIDLLYSAQVGGWTLAYKAIIRNPCEFYLSKRDEFQTHDEKMGLNASATSSYDSKDISTFHNLVTHDASKFKKAPELMMQALTAVYLFRLLEKSGYFKEDLNDSTSMFFMKLIHHYMRCVYYNTHEITTNNENEYGKYTIQRIGRATNPTLALFNHSCDPNYRRVSSGRWTYGFASKPILKGAEIFDTYTQTFASADKETRLKSLEKYNFTCECEPCNKDLPTLEFLPKDINKGPVKKLANKLITSLSRLYTKDENMARNLEIIFKMYNEMYGLLHGAPHQFLIRSEADVYNAIIASVEKLGVDKVFSVMFKASSK
nr:SET and MYND domain-containing protein 4-like [Lepeophtheirus salmonis]XP_040567333.1 SET and MYND domain-containing protein 4-like [Lepeophtheirus salmonis]